jgi:hypothetical protein
MNLLRQSTAVTLRIGPFLDKTDGVTEETALSLTSADVQISKAGAAFGNKGDATAPVHDSDGWYSCLLNTTDTGTLGRLIVKVHDAAIHLPVWHDFEVVHANYFDYVQGVITPAANVTLWLGVAPLALSSQRVQALVGAISADAITATAIQNNAITAAKINDAAITAAKFNAGAIDANALAGDAGTELADALLKRDLSLVTGEAARSVLNALRILRNKWTVMAGVLSVKKEDDSTEAWNAALTSLAGADPITGQDPT